MVGKVVSALFALISATSLMVVLSLPARAAPDRVALVIGVGDYGRATPGIVTITSLAQPAADAEAMFDKLKRLKFDVGDAPLLNPSKVQLETALRSFRLKAQQAQVALIYFSGHGATIAGISYVIPSDFRMTEGAALSAVADQAVRLSAMTNALAAGQVNLLIVDACRNEPQFRRPVAKSLVLVDDVQTGVAEPQAARATTGLLIAFAAAPGNPAFESANGRNSMFTAALLDKIDTSGVELRQALQSAAAKVYQQSERRQEPWIVGSMAQEFYFRPIERPGRNWILAENGQCRLYNWSPQQGERVYWTGACLAGAASGLGVLLWTRNGAFAELDEGTWQGGYESGPFTIRFANGNTAVGIMKAGRWDGPVKTVDSTGRSTEVIFRDGVSVDPSASGKVGLVICNSGSEDAFFAYARQNGAQFTARGWWKVSAKDCRTLIGQRLADEPFYFFAQSPSGKKWFAGPADPGRSFCLDLTQPFEVAENAACGAGTGALFKLHGRQPRDGLLTWTISE